jgi:hypothetical protein
LLNLPLIMMGLAERILAEKWAVGSGQLADKTKGSRDASGLYCLLAFSANCPLPTILALLALPAGMVLD